MGCDIKVLVNNYVEETLFELITKKSYTVNPD